MAVILPSSGGPDSWMVEDAVGRDGPKVWCISSILVVFLLSAFFLFFFNAA